jgi:hypothetical protein
MITSGTPMGTFGRVTKEERTNANTTLKGLKCSNRPDLTTENIFYFLLFFLNVIILRESYGTCSTVHINWVQHTIKVGPSLVPYI